VSFAANGVKSLGINTSGIVAPLGADLGNNGMWVKKKKISIGTWDISTVFSGDTTVLTKNVAHGLGANFIKITNVYIRLFSDDGASSVDTLTMGTITNAGISTSSYNAVACYSMTSTNIVVIVTGYNVSGPYDSGNHAFPGSSTNWDGTSVSRGDVIIEYEA
jgi:hypothetical protein